MIPQVFGTNKDSQHNVNFIDSDGILHNIYVGNQTVNTLTSAHDELLEITTALREQGKRIIVLTDIRKLGKLNVEARMYAVDFIKDIDFDKVAIFGNHMLAEQMVNFIIIASGRGYKMKYFSCEKDARLWLSF